MMPQILLILDMTIEQRSAIIAALFREFNLHLFKDCICTPSIL